MAALSSDPASLLPLGSSQTVEETGPGSQEERPSSQDSCQEEVDAVEPIAAEEPVAAEVGEPAKAAQEPVQPALEPVTSLPPTLKRQSSGDSPPESSSYSVTQNVFTSFSSTPGYLANRWNSINSSFSTPASSQPVPLFTPPMYVLCASEKDAMLT
jgi:hypothetical protein